MFSVQPEKHIPVLLLQIRRDALPFHQGPEFFFGEIHNRIGRLSTEELHQSCGRFYESADSLKRLHAPGKYLEFRGETQVSRFPDKPPALACCQHFVLVEDRAGNAESFLQITEQLGAMLIPCEPGP